MVPTILFSLISESHLSTSEKVCVSWNSIILSIKHAQHVDKEDLTTLCIHCFMSFYVFPNDVLYLPNKRLYIVYWKTPTSNDKQVYYCFLAKLSSCYHWICIQVSVTIKVIRFSVNWFLSSHFPLLGGCWAALIFSDCSWNSVEKKKEIAWDAASENQQFAYATTKAQISCADTKSAPLYSLHG